MPLNKIHFLQIYNILNKYNTNKENGVISNFSWGVKQKCGNSKENCGILYEVKNGKILSFL